MSQPSVTAYFNARKRQACDELRGKSKVLLLERNHSSSQTLTNIENSEQPASPDEKDMGTSPKIVLKDAPTNTPKEDTRANKAVRNIQFDSPKANSEKTSKPRARATRSRALSFADGSQADIRDSLLKMRSDHQAETTKKVPFEKKGMLSPKKNPQTPKKSSAVPNASVTKEIGKEQSANGGSLTPSLSTKISTIERLAKYENLSLDDIKKRINKSPRLMELKARVRTVVNQTRLLEQLQKQNDVKKPQIQKFEKIELEIPVSPQKGYKSPTKDRDLSKTVSPQRRILFEPKETTPSPVKCSPGACRKYLPLVQSKRLGLALPYSYRFLTEVFRCVDMVSAMLFNRNELITFSKLKLEVQKLLRRNFTQEHLAQIKTIYPDAYTYHQEKHRNFGSVSKQEKYELVLTPIVEKINGRNTPDADNVLKTASQSSMSPTILLERKKKFCNTLLERVKDEHEKFLLSIEMNIPREKITGWHPDFDVESCKEIERAVLPQSPHIEKPTAKDVLDKVKSLFNCGTNMEKALQRLAESNLTSKSKSSSSTTQDSRHTLFKGIPKALLEKIRAKQAALALEAMTRTPNADKEAALYSRLPELAKLLRNIFVAEKKSVLSMETTIQKLDNSFRAKLTSHEMEEHIRQLCILFPTWVNIYNVRKINYLKLDKNVELTEVIKRLEISANEIKMKSK